MMYYAIGEPEYKTSNWYKSIFNGLLYERRQKRFSLTELDDMQQLERIQASNEDLIFVIGTNSQWLERTTRACESVFNNRVIVLANHENRFSKGKYSIVTADITNSVQLLYRYLQYHGKKRIAMYGINPGSSSDAYRKRSFLLCGGQEQNMFYNTISLSQCYDDFADRVCDYDAVICVNDYAAISLIRHLPDYRKLFITSCGSGSHLAEFFRPTITHTRVNYEDFGKAGLDLCRVLQKNSNANSVNIYLDGEFVLGETTCGLPLMKETSRETANIDKDEFAYYEDQEIDEMMKLEMLLNSCDAENMYILRGILNNRTYASLAEERYMSVNGIKYKMRNMCHLCGVRSRTELLDLLRKYICKL